MQSLRPKLQSMSTPLKQNKSKLIAIAAFFIVSIPMIQFANFPVYPDEIAFRLLSGRWLTEGLRATGIHWICHPTGVKLEYFFLPAAAILQAVNSLLEITNLQRYFAIISLSLAMTITLTAIVRVRGIQITAFLPIAVLYMGLIPVFLLIQRPEQLWIFAALGLLTSVSVKSHPYKIGFLLASFIFFYVGFFVHVEFLLLLPAILVAGWQILKTRLKKITWIALGILTAIAGRAQSIAASECIGHPSYNEFLKSISSPKLNSLDSFWNDFWKSLVVGGNFSPINIAPPLPEFSLIIDFQKAGFIIILLAMLFIAIARAAMLCLSSKKRINSNERKIWIDPILRDSSMTGLFILIACFGLIAFDPLHVFYRNTAALVIGSFAIAQQPNLSPVISLKKHNLCISLKIVLILVVMGSMMSSILMWPNMINKLEAGYVGPSLSQKDWETTNKRPLDKNIMNFISSNPSESIIIDDSTYNIAKLDYKHLVPITYLSLAIANGAHIDSKRQLTFKSMPAIVTCLGNEELLSKLSVDIEKKYADPKLGRDICMGKSQIEQNPGQE